MVCLQVVTSMLLYKDYYCCPLLGFGQNLGLGLWSQARVKMRPPSNVLRSRSYANQRYPSLLFVVASAAVWKLRNVFLPPHSLPLLLNWTGVSHIHKHSFILDIVTVLIVSRFDMRPSCLWTADNKSANQQLVIS